ncbi:helix-turn-helix transcriptional regulator [Nonomuraea sp. NPDC050556]|uniref:helix-turn-helix transcriptional regulator n=1 Tax=Nonomuraea sp. NPDC050556 TaxID=3364369 RepID=UPI0037BA0382
MEDRRSDLAAFLRTRRERITPEMVGLPSGRRRRTPGLRREEVAQLAGVGVTWYTWLEQGRPINASVQVLDAIARTLRLERAEHGHFYRLAGLTVAPSKAECATVTAEMQQILDQLTPMPAAIVTSRHDVLAWNAAYAALFPELVGAPEEERNSLWQAFVLGNWATEFTDRAEELSGAVAIFRGSYSRHADDPTWQEFVRRLCAMSAEFAAMWERQDVAEPGGREKRFRHADVGDMTFRSSVFGYSGAPETRLVVYSPGDENTRSAVIWLMSYEREEAGRGMLGA